MSSWIEILVNGLLCIAAIEIQLVTESILKQTARARWVVASSQERCPTLSDSRCNLVISARSYGHWHTCDSDHAPSGANLPMHRWFKISGTCNIKIADVHLSVHMPEQLVFR